MGLWLLWPTECSGSDAMWFWGSVRRGHAVFTQFSGGAHSERSQPPCKEIHPRWRLPCWRGSCGHAGWQSGAFRWQHLQSLQALRSRDKHSPFFFSKSLIPRICENNNVVILYHLVLACLVLSSSNWNKPVFPRVLFSNYHLGSTLKTDSHVSPTDFLT